MTTFEKLNSKCSKCTKCDLSIARLNVVFGSGNPNADILILGEAPGKKESETGLPFVGTAGKKLDGFLDTIGLKREDVFIANILKCRPPENRDPTKEEISTCTPWLYDQIKIINPKVICPLGNFSSRYILSGCKPEEMKKIDTISKTHGEVFEVEIHGETKTVIPLYHPAALIYNRKLIPDMGEDLKVVKKIVKNLI